MDDQKVKIVKKLIKWEKTRHTFSKLKRCRSIHPTVLIRKLTVNQHEEEEYTEYNVQSIEQLIMTENKSVFKCAEGTLPTCAPYL